MQLPRALVARRGPPLAIRAGAGARSGPALAWRYQPIVLYALTMIICMITQLQARALQSQGRGLRVGPPAFGKDLPIWQGPPD